MKWVNCASWSSVPLISTQQPKVCICLWVEIRVLLYCGPWNIRSECRRGRNYWEGMLCEEVSKFDHNWRIIAENDMRSVQWDVWVCSEGRPSYLHQCTYWQGLFVIHQYEIKLNVLQYLAARGSISQHDINFWTEICKLFPEVYGRWRNIK